MYSGEGGNLREWNNVIPQYICDRLCENQSYGDAIESAKEENTEIVFQLTQN